MNRKAFMILAFLLLLYIPAVNIVPSSDGPAIVTGPDLQEDFTLTEIMFNDTYDDVDAGEASPEDAGNIDGLAEVGGQQWAGLDTSGDPPYVVDYCKINFTIPNGAVGFFWNVYIRLQTNDDDGGLYIWDYGSSEWDLLVYQPDNSSFTWYNGTTHETNYLGGNDVIFMFNSTETGAGIAAAYFDFARVKWYIETNSFSYWFVTPERPLDTEAVTFSAVTSPDENIESGKLNAVIYPSGFSDVDYTMSEDPDGVFIYTFSTMIAGYYLFTLRLSNSTHIVYSSYIALTVVTDDIRISPITMFGVGNDFTQMQVSFEINKDANYTIYESSATVSEIDTYNGSVTVGWSNIAWTKLDTIDLLVDFGILFESGTLSTWVNGSYSVAQTTFYVEFFNHNGPNGAETVTVAGRITKLATYTVYIDDVEATTGAITDLDFDIDFSKTSTGAARQSWHNWAIKFVNGSQTCWANGTFYLWLYNPDQPPGGGVVVFDENFWLKIMIAMSVVIGVGIVILKSTGFGNLPNYKGDI